MKSILDPSFRYTASFNTDLRETFARIRRYERRDAKHELAPPVRPLRNVSSIIRTGTEDSPPRAFLHPARASK